MTTVSLDEARRRRDGGGSGGPHGLKVIDPIKWQNMPLPERKWIVDGVIPLRSTMMLSGDGGLGKSLLAMQLSTACATGNSWLGMPTTACKVLAVHCEDTDEELQIRQHAINRHYSIDFGDLENLRLVSRVGDDNVLLETDKFGKTTGRTTALYNQILRAANDFGAQLVILDSLHDLFAGNENVRAEARHFVGQLRRIALELDGAVVLLSHPSAAGLSSGSGTSGSTAWNAAVRSRLYLTRPKDDEYSDRDARVLKGMKSNYGKDGEEIHLRWEDGVFVRTDRPAAGGLVDKLDRNSRRAMAEEAFLTALGTLLRQGHEPSFRIEARSLYAPRLAATLPEMKDYAHRDIEDAMRSLMAAGEVVIAETAGPPSRRRKIIVPKGYAAK